ncbi:MAG: hypothetical protein ACFFKA_10810, partial [Candidatus Thorarchaeota archaeon]
IFFSPQLNLLVWKLSIISGFITLTVTIIILSFFREYKKLPLSPFIVLFTFYGLLVGTLILPDSIIIEYYSDTPYTLTIINPANIHYHFNSFTGFIIIITLSFISLYFSYISIFIYFRVKKKRKSLPLLLNTIIFLIPIIMLVIYISTELTIFRELYIILLWIAIFGVNIMLIKDPEMFFILPNEIYSINIFHKSGVMLYSYNFGKKIDYDPSIWGNTLIGLNHILSEFIDKTDKIDVIQTKNAEIVVNYDDDYGYAVVLITNQKNSIIENLIRKFSTIFREYFSRELNEIRDLNRIINVSEFKASKEIVEETFKLYL